ncbi:TonB-dependent receptor [Altibacter sp. HG106]|uniref:TonB-dependent receptor n=1 Tax=Altibacter sp. HG106 TaxID=3023937 RepID=UPI002350FF23|nr:TonB-dependent receptor [Altibacter sp. HG106]MDC7993822.1 TonB-dependent receptor [Altibacter sp. HG106]
MTKLIFLVQATILALSTSLLAQQQITGTVTDRTGTPIFGANVYLEGTYDGASTNETGGFLFETSETGVKTLVISFITYETLRYEAAVTTMNGLSLQLREDVNTLDAVTVSAGTFEAGDNSKVSVLNPLDVVTTASALGDFVGALQTLPGTTTVAEDGRLFVRGGSADETQIFIDGIRVFAPYTPTTNNIPTRGRYSPFLFDGITFSTGGYAAEYGEALSSVLLLNTVDEPDQEKTDISIMSVGLGLGNTQKWERSSLSVNASYINLAPYIALIPDRNNWQQPYQGFSGEAVYRFNTENGLLKAYAAFDHSEFELTQPSIDMPEGVRFALNNSNFYTNSSWSQRLQNKWKLFVGGSYTYTRNKIGILSNQIENGDHSAHVKATLQKSLNSRWKVQLGAEQFLTEFSERFASEAVRLDYGFSNPITATFAETDYRFSKRLAVNFGLRGSYYGSSNLWRVSPRVATALKLGEKGQVSAAFGTFYQQPTQEVLKFASEVAPRQANHYILNYQYVKNNRILRAEVFRKTYQNLITYTTEEPQPNIGYSNSGEGYAQGLDLFWRDEASIKNLDYWVSYSYLDSERRFENYPIQAQPSFANTHNLSVVGKYWVDSWKSQLGMSYQYASGRPYTNPNEPGWLQERTKDFHGLSLNWAYLLSPQKILYVSVNNVLGIQNINGYEYASSPNAAGVFDRRAVRPAADQFFFVGFFWTLSEDGTDNQLDNL